MRVSSSKSKVYFFSETHNLKLSNRSLLKSFIEKLFRLEKKKLDSLNYVFTDDEQLLKINQEYLDHDDLTDIITFDLDKDKVVGEIYISIERVKENARNRGIAFKDELLRVMFHGALHLCGYKDKKMFHVKIMRAKEEEYLKKYHKYIKRADSTVSRGT